MEDNTFTFVVLRTPDLEQWQVELQAGEGGDYLVISKPFICREDALAWVAHLNSECRVVVETPGASL